MLGHVEGAEIYFHELIRRGRTREEHDQVLLEVLRRAQSRNRKINPDKFQFRVNEIKYMGLIISKGGFRANPSLA